MMKCRAIQNTQMEKYSMKRLVKMVEKMTQFLSREHASFSILGKDIGELREYFKHSTFDQSGVLSVFPSSVSLMSYQVHAAYVLFLLNDHCYGKLSPLLCERLQLDSLELNTLLHQVDGNHPYFMDVRQDFNGYLIKLVSNDQVLLEQIYALKLQPPPPWIATNLNPVDVIFLQGKEEYYWHTFWLRFVETLNEAELAEYYQENDISELWQDYLSSDIHL